MMLKELEQVEQLELKQVQLPERHPSTIRRPERLRTFTNSFYKATLSKQSGWIGPAGTGLPVEPEPESHKDYWL